MTMENFREFPLEVRLSALIDGQVGDEERKELEDLIASDESARTLFNTLQAGSEFGNQAFAGMLEEPVPLELERAVRKIAAREKSRPVRQAANSNNISFFRMLPQAIAASAVLLLAGGYSGYFIGQNNAIQQPAAISDTAGLEATVPAGEAKTRGFTFNAPIKPVEVADGTISLAEIAAIHGVYASAKTHIAELPATDAGAIVSYLSASTGVAFSIPDLAANGYQFQGGRLIAAEGKPGGALYYSNGKGDVLGLYFIKGELADISSTPASFGSNDVLAWEDRGAQWFLAGPLGAALPDIAAKAGRK
jgi:anti-sigma factor RsiW